MVRSITKAGDILRFLRMTFRKGSKELRGYDTIISIDVEFIHKLGKTM